MNGMIEAGTDRKWLPLYEALASDVRLSIVELLAEQSMNVKDIAIALGLSSAIVTMHVRKLETAGLVETKMVRKDGGTHKMCTLAQQSINIQLPRKTDNSLKYHETFVPIGHYSECEVHPTCGIATAVRMIGQFDDPRYFMEPQRMHAGILWFGHGYLDYKLPNYLLPGQRPRMVEITLELGSEAPGFREHWPSDISFELNGKPLGIWTSPGDYGSQRGRYSPDWWPEFVNQYGLLKLISVQEDGTFIDGQKISDCTIGNIELDRNLWSFRIGVKADAVHRGGLTLYGNGFGNYSQDIKFKVYYD
jgi:predicted transcriptional regulator